MISTPTELKDRKYPTCPGCGSSDFYVDGFVGYRQPYDAKGGEYAISEIFWEEDYATGARCASCERDATDLFKEFGVLSFYIMKLNER